MASGLGVAIGLGIFGIFIAGAMLGVIGMVAIAVWREKPRRGKTLRDTAPGRLTDGARWLNGVGTRNTAERDAERGELVRH